MNNLQLTVTHLPIIELLDISGITYPLFKNQRNMTVLQEVQKQ